MYTSYIYQKLILIKQFSKFPFAFRFQFQILFHTRKKNAFIQKVTEFQSNTFMPKCLFDIHTTAGVKPEDEVFTLAAYSRAHKS